MEFGVSDTGESQRAWSVLRVASLHFCGICPRRGECSASAAETLHSPPLGRMDRLGLYLLSNRALPRACLCVVAAAQL